MTTPEHNHPSWITRICLLVFGCAPMMFVHGTTSLLMIFPVISLAAGNWLQALFLLWWLIGTVGLLVLAYTSATFNPSGGRLPVGQVVGLASGIVAAIPLVLGFFGEWWTSLSALLACLASAYILVNHARSSKVIAGDASKRSGRVSP